MAEWLFEILSEEIPSRFQPNAQKQLKTLAEKHLTERGIAFSSLQTFVTPRRLTLVAEGLPLQTEEAVIEKKGPREDAPSQAIEGFLNSNGVLLQECEVRETPKGNFLFVVTREPGRPMSEILSLISLEILEEFHWPKSMRWGSLPVTWVRPLQNLLNLFDGKVVPLSYANLEATNTTYGHRFMAPQGFTISNFKDYQEKLKKHFVVLDWAERRERIQEGVTKVAQGLNVLDDPSLFDEVTGLVEWPVPLRGKVDAHFMHLPREVITTPMRVHQRYFPLLNEDQTLAPFFGLIANVESPDKGETIIRENERVLRARLADAQFFWEQDLKGPLEHFNLALKTRVFQKDLGSLFDKVERLEKLSAKIAEALGQDPVPVRRAATLSKADLASQMVNEFPELQGTMGRYYALNKREDSLVAQAIEEHYWPKGAGDKLPESVPSLILALADRIDTLVGFFAIGITPSGSKDPFALRRAGLGLIALSLDPRVKLSMLEVLGWAYDIYPWSTLSVPHQLKKEDALKNLWQFLLERFKFALRDGQGSPYDHVDAVLSVADENPTFYDLSLRAQALDQLMKGTDGQNLLTAYKRASNILRIEEEKDKKQYQGPVVADILALSEEKTLFAELNSKMPHIEQLIGEGNFIKAVQDLARLRPFVDQFFDKVVVNAEEKDLRQNRLLLLSLLRNSLHQVADFSKIEG